MIIVYVAYVVSYAIYVQVLNVLLTVLTISERTTAKHERRSEQHKTAAATSIIIDIAIGAYLAYIFYRTVLSQLLILASPGDCPLSLSLLSFSKFPHAIRLIISHQLAFTWLNCAHLPFSTVTSSILRLFYLLFITIIKYLTKYNPYKRILSVQHCVFRCTIEATVLSMICGLIRINLISSLSL